MYIIILKNRTIFLKNNSSALNGRAKRKTRCSLDPTRINSLSYWRSESGVHFSNLLNKKIINATCPISNALHCFHFTVSIQVGVSLKSAILIDTASINPTAATLSPLFLSLINIALSNPSNVQPIPHRAPKTPFFAFINKPDTYFKRNSVNLNTQNSKTRT